MEQRPRTADTHPDPAIDSGVDQKPNEKPDATVDARFDDENYPAYTMGRAADMLNTTPAFLRGLDEAGLLQPQRSPGGHRRYSRDQLRIAARVRELVDQGTALAAACRIVSLENELAEARGAHGGARGARGHTPPTRTRPTRRGRSGTDQAGRTSQGRHAGTDTPEQNQPEHRQPEQRQHEQK